MFGGHEWNGKSLMSDCSHGRGVCKNCIKKAEEINKRNGFDLK
jgi:hypothetical protein